MTLNRIPFLQTQQPALALDPLDDAARFLAQATLGATPEEIEALAGTDYAAWIDAQKNAPISLNKPYIETVANFFETATDNQKQNSVYMNALSGNFSTSWMRNIVFGEDQLRQRVAWALSQILVISYNSNRLRQAGTAVADYYDTLAQHALGNFRDLIGAVSNHPAMSYFLSFLGNGKAIPEQNQYPDENYAREVMQLFTIGLWELRENGERKVDGQGNFIPTYDNEDITEMARVFTGLYFEGERFRSSANFQIEVMNTKPLVMFEEYHDVEAKTLFHGKNWETTLPAGQSGMQDIDAALDVLFNHPNTPPFICKKLIQFLVKSNPTPGYINRISQLFKDNGDGVRGDLFAVVKAILLDDEARLYNPSGNRLGKLHEPMVRLTRMVKAFKAGVNTPNFVYWRFLGDQLDIGQWPMYSPSVFNFFSPEYRHNGPLAQNGLVSPEFMILTPTTVAEIANHFAFIIDNRVHQPRKGNPPEFKFDFSAEMALAADADALIDRLDWLLCYGQMADNTRALIKAGIETFNADSEDDRWKRVRIAVYMTAMSTEGSTLR